MTKLKFLIVLAIVAIAGFGAKDYMEKEEVKAQKQATEEQKADYDQAAQIAQLVKDAKSELKAEGEKIGAGKGDPQYYTLLEQNVTQYEMMYSEVQSTYNCKYFDACFDEKATELAANPLPASIDTLLNVHAEVSVKQEDNSKSDKAASSK